MTLKEAIQIIKEEYTLSPDKYEYISSKEEEALQVVFNAAELQQQMFNLLDGRD